MKSRATVFLASMLTLGLLAGCSDSAPTETQRPPVEVSVAPNTTTLTVGQTATLAALVLNDTTGPLSGVTWSSNAAAVASVNATTGVVTAVSPGTATITATSKFRPTVSATTQVIVTPSTVPELFIVVAPPTATIVVGGTVNLVAQAGPLGARFRSSNAAVARVDSLSGQVTGVSGGTATITARAMNDTTKTAVSVITVTTPNTGPLTSVSITPASATLTVGGTAQFTGSTNGFTSAITYRSSDAAVATVNGTGLVTGVSAGQATITAIAVADTTKRASGTVTVTAVNAPVSVGVTPSTASTAPNTTAQFTVSITGGTNAAAQGFTVTSSNTSVASIQSQTTSGFIASANSPGNANFTVTSIADATKSQTVTLTVLPFPAALNIPVLGSGAVPERFTAEVAVRGDFAYTTTWSTRSFNGVNSAGNVTKIWNIASGTPVLVDSLKIQGVGTTSDVQISPDGTLLVTSTEGGLNTGSIAIYSLANPARPTLISRYQSIEIQRGVHTVKMSVINGRLYGFLQVDPTSAGLAQLVIVDMTDPANVQQVFKRVMGAPYIHDVFVRDGLLFAANWNDGMTIFDIGGGGMGGTPSNPVQLSIIKTKTGQIHNIWWFQDPRGGPDAKKYVFLGEEGPSVGPIGAGGTTQGDIHVIDISNILAPKEVAIYTLGSSFGVHNFWADEASGILYAAYYNGGVRAIDVRGDLGTCTAAQRAAQTSITGAALCDLRLMGREAGTALTTGGFFVWGVMMQGSRLYASDMGKGLVVLDISSLKR